MTDDPKFWEVMSFIDAILGHQLEDGGWIASLTFDVTDKKTGKKTKYKISKLGHNDEDESEK